MLDKNGHTTLVMRICLHLRAASNKGISAYGGKLSKQSVLAAWKQNSLVGFTERERQFICHTLQCLALSLPPVPIFPAKQDFKDKTVLTIRVINPKTRLIACLVPLENKGKKNTNRVYSPWNQGENSRLSPERRV